MTPLAEGPDHIDILSAFITVGGVRALRAALDQAVLRGAKIRVLTTVFTGTTEVEAIDMLARLPNAEVENGWSFFLFVRADADAPYAFLGPVRYLRHEGDRPIGITWSLEHAMPGALYDRFATLAQG